MFSGFLNVLNKCGISFYDHRNSGQNIHVPFIICVSGADLQDEARLVDTE